MFVCVCVSKVSVLSVVSQWPDKDFFKLRAKGKKKCSLNLCRLALSWDPCKMLIQDLWLWLSIYLLLAQTSNINQGPSVGSSYLFSEHMPGPEHPVTLSIPLKPLSLKYFHPQPSPSHAFQSIFFLPPLLPTHMLSFAPGSYKWYMSLNAFINLCWYISSPGRAKLRQASLLVP